VPVVKVHRLFLDQNLSGSMELKALVEKILIARNLAREEISHC
jgi:uncharacterized protein VirK/YbjX